MILNINEKLYLAVRNYFFLHNKDLCTLEFGVPKNRRIRKVPFATREPSAKLLNAKLQNQNKNSGFLGVRTNLGEIKDLSNRQAAPRATFTYTKTETHTENSESC